MIQISGRNNTLSALLLVVLVFFGEGNAQRRGRAGQTVQNAVLEGIQFTTEPGAKPDEQVVTCYFIFIDKPSAYFYEIRRKPTELVFEFNDTKRSTAPVASIRQQPVSGFTIEEHVIDINKEIKGLIPDLRDVVRVRFKLDDVPKVTVTDEYNVVSFKYLWSTNPAKQRAYVQADNNAKVLLWSTAGLSAIAGGAAYYYFQIYQPTPPGAVELSITDLPKHPEPPGNP